MQTYANILSKREEKPTNVSDFTEISLEELEAFHFNRKYKSSNTLLSPTEMLFLDINGEIIYNLYYELREYYETSEYFKKIDYNGFLDIFLKNVIYEEIPDDSEDDGNNENEE